MKEFDSNDNETSGTNTALTKFDWKSHVFPSCFLLLISIVIYFQATSYGYILDDKIVITDNKFTKEGLDGIYDLMTTESMTGYFGEQKNLVQGNRYRPLSLVTFALEYEMLGGLNPKVSHWINIFLYGLTGIVIYFLLLLLLDYRKRSFTTARWFALAVAFLFIAHPIHVEAVANIKGRDEIMAFFFALLALRLGYLHHVKGGWGKLLLANIFFILGLLSKENTITFLAVLPLTFYFMNKTTLLKSIKGIWSYVLSTSIYLIWRFSVSGVPKLGQESQDLMNNPFLGMDVIERFSTILFTLGWYIKLLFVPFPLTHDYYPYAIPKMDLSDIGVWISLIIYAFLLLYSIKNFSKKQLTVFSILYYLVTLTIVSNVVINLGTFMNDRFIYFSSLGFILLLVLGVETVSKKYFSKPNIVFLSGIAIIGMLYTSLSIIRVPDWETALTLNRSAIKVSSNSARANTFMGTALFQEARSENDMKKRETMLREAKPYAEKAVEIYPNYYNGNLMLAGIAAEIHKIDGKVDPLIIEFEKVMKVRPDINFLSEYLTYLNERNRHQTQISQLCNRVGRSLILRNKNNDARWALHYLNMAYQNNSQDLETVQLISQAYQLTGDLNSANQFNNLARTLMGQ